jgi:hypothetical protein
MKLLTIFLLLIVTTTVKLPADEIISEFTYISDSHQYTYTITKDALTDMPVWKEGQEPPLTSFRVKHLAEAYGRETLKIPGLEVESITLEKLFRRNFWYYVVHLAPGDVTDAKKPSFDVVIWMNGKIAKPTKIN